MPHDKVIIQYRDKLAEFAAKGWRLDHVAINEARAKGDAIYAIPSPARRDGKGWVLDAAPLMPPDKAKAAAAE